jgi:hypothetical protein
MGHHLAPSTVTALKLRQNGGTLRGLAYSLGFDDFMVPVLSGIMRDIPGACSLERENVVRAALNLQPRARRRYLRPCLSLDPAVRAGQLRALLAAAEAAMEETP